MANPFRRGADHTGHATTTGARIARLLLSPVDVIRRRVAASPAPFRFNPSARFVDADQSIARYWRSSVVDGCAADLHFFLRARRVIHADITRRGIRRRRFRRSMAGKAIKNALAYHQMG